MRRTTTKSSTVKNRARAIKAQKQANKYAYRLKKKALNFEKFKQKQATKRLNQIPEGIKAAGKAIALASSPTAGSIASTQIATSKDNQQIIQLIDPTRRADTNNAEEDKELDSKDGSYVLR